MSVKKTKINFAFQGLSSESISEIVNDRHTKLVVLDKGNGYIRHELHRFIKAFFNSKEAA